MREGEGVMYFPETDLMVGVDMKGKDLNILHDLKQMAHLAMNCNPKCPCVIIWDKLYKDVEELIAMKDI
jgi:hypothetical protein